MKPTRITPTDTVRATVAYADVFDFPLTRDELRRWIIMTPVNLRSTPGVETDGRYYFLHGRAALAANRFAISPFQQEKWQIAEHAAKLLCCIPTIELVGVTGGLAMNNARKDDDIDLFLIAARGTLWVSRFLATTLIQITGLRRDRKSLHVANKVCLNMFMASVSRQVPSLGLEVPPAERDLFAAHEVLQMVPMWEQVGVYKQFLTANQWVSTYLPVAWEEKKRVAVPQAHRTPQLIVWLFRLFEYPAKVMQLTYMARHRTYEVITHSALRFHPLDARVWVKKKFAVRLKRFGIPLDKVFLGS